MDIDQIVQTVTTIGVAFGLKVLGAVVWVVGRCREMAVKSCYEKFPCAFLPAQVHNA